MLPQPRSHFFCRLESTSSPLAPPKEENPWFLKKLKEIEEKANQTDNKLHQILLKNKIFRQYVLCGLIDLDELPPVTLNNLHRYTNQNIQKLVIRQILLVDDIASLKPEEYNNLCSSYAIKLLLSGSINLEEAKKGKFRENNNCKHQL